MEKLCKVENGREHINSLPKFRMGENVEKPYKVQNVGKCRKRFQSSACGKVGKVKVMNGGKVW